MKHRRSPYRTATAWLFVFLGIALLVFGSCKSEVESKGATSKRAETSRAEARYVDVGFSSRCWINRKSEIQCEGRMGFGLEKVPTGEFTQLQVGAQHACALDQKGSLRCWGAEGPLAKDVGQLDAPSGVFRHFSMGSTYGCALSATTRELSCWGRFVTQPPNATRAPPPVGRFRDVSVGEDHACAVGEDGTLWCWGDATIPELITPAGADCKKGERQGAFDLWHCQLAGKSFVGVASGREHSCAWNQDGAMRCWGRNHKRQATPPNRAVKAMSTGGAMSCGIETGDTLFCFGDAAAAKFPGAQCESYLDAGALCRSNGAARYQRISVGQRRSCAVQSGDLLMCWDHTASKVGKKEGRSP